jgi:protein ImuB
LFLVPPGETLAWLRPLPVEALRLSAAVMAVLNQLGVRRVEQLEAIPRREFSARFGPELLAAWDRATGRLGEPFPAYAPPPQLAARWTPESPTARRETIEAAFERLARKIAAGLSRSGRGATQLECRLECTAGGPLQLSVGLFQPTARPRYIVDLLRLRFDAARLPGAVRSVHLAVTLSAPLELRQQELFARGSPRRNPRHLAGLIDRLSNRLGRQMVLGVRLVPDAQPELACRYVPMVAGVARRRGSSSAVPAEDAPRPLRLLRRPLLLPAGIAAALCLAGSQHQVVRTWGPERIETGWWRGPAAARDYYRLETAAGRRFWAFRRLGDDRWFLHGIFD